jgi:hypothetical protein
MGKIKGFYELAKNLPIGERKELYERILKSLSLQEENDEELYRPEESLPGQHEMILNDVQNLGFWERFKFWLRRLFSTKTHDEIFIEMKIDQIKRRVRGINPDVYKMETKTLTSEFAEHLYNLYRTVYPVIPFFNTMWTDKDFFQKMINALLEQTIPEAKTMVYDFVPKKDLEELMIQDDTKRIIRKELKKQINEYLTNIPPDIFTHLESGIMPLYLLKYIALFPFAEVLSMFLPEGVIKRGDIPEENPPDFRNIGATPIMNRLESLYFALYAASKLEKGFTIHKELIEYYVANLENQEQNKDFLIKGIRKFLQSIREGALDFRNGIPLAEIIKVYHANPYFRFLVYLPKINLREFYASALTIAILSQLDEMLPQIRKGVVEKLKKKIFHYPPADFEYYRRSAQSTIKKLGLPTFKYVKSINVLYNYLRRNFRHSLQDFIAILDKIIPVRFRDVQRRLRSTTADLSDLTDRIRDFDYSFSPETEDGKSFYRIRYSVEKDISQQKVYRMLVAQKDREAKQLLDRGIENLLKLENALKELKKHASRPIQERYSAYDPLTPGDVPFEKAVEQEIQSLESIRNLVYQLQAIEEGR